MPASIATVLPVSDLPAAVAFWTAALDTPPTFIDGARWAQFDADGRRLCLAGTDRSTDAAGVLIKVDDLGGTQARLRAAGITVTSLETGPHERRFVAVGPDGWTATYYATV
jgi:catechol 2,3-dioxygenase-like lactoylglutathione lyase family enzyme